MIVADIGGLDHAKEEIFEGVIIPMQHPEIFEAESTSLLSPPRGVLLHGPPGTGKTMMAQAIAKECNCTFINIRMSTVMSMWSGEAQKLISALFSLAELLKPSIIFIDEIDTFLRNRDATMYKSETMESMKTEFFQCWDGMLSSKATQIVVIGATNRPQDVDAAAVR